jgi:hypothetical protein
MRASPHSSSRRRTKCERITCEHARKPPRRVRRANLPSAGDALRDTRRGEPGRPTFYAEAARPSLLTASELHLAKSLRACSLHAAQHPA